MTLHHCTFPHILGYAKPDHQAEPERPKARDPEPDSDEGLAAMAALPFKPWDRSNCPLPSNQEWIDGVNPYLISLRLAFLTMCQTKDELVGTVQSLAEDGDGDALTELLGRIRDVEKLMRGYGQLAGAAEARIMCAMAVLATREDQACA